MRSVTLDQVDRCKRTAPYFRCSSGTSSRMSLRRGRVLQATLWHAIPTTTVFPYLPDVREVLLEKALLGRTAVATYFGHHPRHGELHAVERRTRRGRCGR